MRKIRQYVLNKWLYSMLYLLSTGISATAQPVLGFSGFITTGLSSPVDITNAGDGTNRLFIVQQTGQIRIYSGGSLLPTPFLNISTIISTGGERGLLSLAFHPDYENNRYFFVYYTNLSGAITIARYQTQAGNPNQADAASGVVLLTIPKPFSNHNGGDLNFGPEGYLYFGTGDGGSGGDPNNYSQNGLSLLGKMIRMDVSNFSTPPYYFIPADNPYTSDPLVDDHIWALGLRNPWRWSFDRTTGDMWIADVGQGSWEEVNFRSAGTTGGVNYGWRCYEGNVAYNTAGCLPQSSYISPIFVYPHVFATGGFSITGGFVYRGAEYPSLQGYYICADYVSGNVWLINPNGSGGWVTRRQAGLPGNIAAFGEAEDGTLYAVSLSGSVYKVDVTAILPHTLLSFSGKSQSGYNELQWNVTSTEQTRRYLVEYSMNGTTWQYAGELPAGNQPNGQLYTFRHTINNIGKIYYRLQIESLTGDLSYSPIISISGNKERSVIKIFPTVITDRQLRINTDEPLTQLKITDSQGRMVFTSSLGGQQGYFVTTIPALGKGMYWVQLVTASRVETQKILVQ
ncbi:MAG: PQQ-dependent sugar dehydrogenase [Bacteroidetes bacterium]|nr:PQQ-dependent sugar dehydrogenase [Bacteroidota bacterium]